MENTIKKIQGWLNSNLHDVYSRKELEGFLHSILDSLEHEKAIAPKPVPQIDPEHIYQVARDKYQEMLNILSTDAKDAIKHIEFDNGAYSISLDCDNKIEVDIDGKEVAEEVMDEIFDYLWDADDFYEHLKRDAEDDNKDQTMEDLKVMEEKSREENIKHLKEEYDKAVEINDMLKMELIEEKLWNKYKIDVDEE